MFELFGRSILVLIFGLFGIFRFFDLSKLNEYNNKVEFIWEKEMVEVSLEGFEVVIGFFIGVKEDLYCDEIVV